MVLFPNCKINIGLNITAKRPDGFHDLETVFFPLPFMDALEIVPDFGNLVSFKSTGLKIPGDTADNLCLKAYNLLKGEYRLPGVKIHLHKVIPMGAGLGGGSSDGAFTLKLLSRLFSLGLSDDQLYRYAGLLGSDCPFFIKNEPVFATGRGEVFSPVTIDLQGYSVVLVIPSCQVNTAWAYQCIIPAAPRISLAEISEANISDWKTMVVNDFENHVFEKFPEIAEIKDSLYRHGAVYASMTGSGSAVYGLFRDEALPAFGFPGASTWTTKIG